MSDTSSDTLRSVWICHPCEVLGADPGIEPMCWNCGGPVTVTARIASAWVGQRLSGFASSSVWAGSA